MHDNGSFHTYLAMFTDIGHEYRISSVIKCSVLFAMCHIYVIQFTYLQASRLRNKNKSKTNKQRPSFLVCLEERPAIIFNRQASAWGHEVRSTWMLVVLSQGDVETAMGINCLEQ